jgi:quinol monooxygenase YgiN
MSNIVSCVAEVNIHDGQVDHLKAFMNAMIDDIQRDEPGTLNYEWFLADDGKSYQVYERYTDSEAYMVHLEIFGQKYAEQILPHVTITKITLYGSPNDAVRGVFTSLPTTYMSRTAGVAR